MTDQHYEITEEAREYLEKMLGDTAESLSATDPEFATIFNNFAFDKLVGSDDIDDRRRFLCIIAGVMGAQGLETFEIVLNGALNFGVDPIEIKEVIYQAVPYLGIARVLPFLTTANKVLAERGIELPLDSQKTVEDENRQSAGNEIQVQVFGEGMRENWTFAPEGRRAINQWLASNCFGDYYTRNGLSLADRELITFCYTISMGGAHPQAISHAIGNIKIGNSAVLLRNAVHQLIPYVGYPRVLNALAAIDNATAAIFEDDTQQRAMKKF